MWYEDVFPQNNSALYVTIGFSLYIMVDLMYHDGGAISFL